MGNILDQVTKLSYHLSGLAMASMLCLVINEVMMRYLFNAPTTWSSDANQWLFALTVMLALPEITRVNGNVAITVILEKMPQKKREIITRALAIVSCLACLLAFYISGTETLRQFSNDITTTWVRPIPKWWISVAIPFGFLLSSIQFLRLGLKPKTSPSIEE
jgi:TRAP-type C4-dicarboxylate transport system permease small subunit